MIIIIYNNRYFVTEEALPEHLPTGYETRSHHGYLLVIAQRLELNEVQMKTSPSDQKMNRTSYEQEGESHKMSRY